MDQVLTWDSHYAVTGSLGPHFEGDDSLRHWIQPGMVNTPRPVSLYSPVDGFRIETTWDDHSETYPPAYDGPDVWVTVTVPEGLHRLSLYVTNKDGHNGGPFTYRDYPVDLLPYRAKMAAAMALKPLARARILNFQNGMYKSFVVRGPGKYYVRVRRNGSFCTLLAGVFVDKMAGPKVRGDNDPIPSMMNVRYEPPDPDAPPLTSNVPLPPPPVLTPTQISTLSAARMLWNGLDSEAAITSPLALPDRLLAYRASLVSGASDRLQENWRWRLHFWTEGDRLWFQRNMALAEAMKHVPSPTY